MISCLPVPYLAPIRRLPLMETIIEWLIRLDVLVAVGILILFPLAFLGVALRDATVARRMLVYWRASSLLAITVYLLSAELAVGYLTGFLSLLFIPAAIWMGDAIYHPPDSPLPGASRLRSVYRGWRWAVTGLCAFSIPLIMPALPCVIGGAPNLFCDLWFALPGEYFTFIHGEADPTVWGWVALGALPIYGLYLALSAVPWYQRYTS